MNPAILPHIAKTGEFATLTATAQMSKRARATLNVRLSLPRRTLAIADPDGTVVMLPRSPSANTGIPVMQIPLSVN